MGERAGEPHSGRYRFLDGLRGALALQVVGLHYVSAFLPSLAYPLFDHAPATSLQAWFAGTPLFFLIDGYSAVYVFFLMSGFVLTPSFIDQCDRPIRNAARRVVRLFLPGVAALLFALILFNLFPGAARDAERIVHARWLVRDEAILAPLSGFGRGVMPAGLPFDPIGVMNALDAPIWTLPIEFYGSLVLIALIYLTRWRWAYWLGLLVLTIAMPSSTMFLFLIGHLAFRLDRRFSLRDRAAGRWAPAVGYVVIAAGIWLCGTKNLSALRSAYDWFAAHTYAAPFIFWHFESEVGAALIFIGVLIAARSRRSFLWRWLESRPLQIAGRYSFSIYLIHYPIVLTVGCYLYAALAPALTRPAVTAIVFVLGIAITLPAVYLFERFVDAPAIAMGRRLKAWPSPSAAAMPATLQSDPSPS